MLVCQQCNYEQQSGKFCGQCGGALAEQSRTENAKTNSETSEAEAAVATETTVAPVQQKKSFQTYVTFIVNLLKNPTRALKLNENQFGYGLITMAIYAFAYALANYFLANKMVKEMFGPLTSSLPFFDLTVPLFFFIILFTVGAFISTFAATKLMNNSSSIKNILAQFGGLLVPFMLINVAMILFGIVGMAKFTIGMTNLSLLFSVYFLPVLLAFHKGTELKGEQKVYFSLGAAALSMLISYIIIRLAILDFLDKFDHVYPWF